MKNTRSTAQLIVFLATLGGVSGGIFAVLTVEQSWSYFLYGASDGVWIGGVMAAYTLLVARGKFGRGFRKCGFLFKVITNSLAYLFIFFAGRYLGHVVQGRAGAVVWDAQLVSSVGFAVILALLVNFILEMSQLVGPKAVWNFVRGIYHKPIEEDRVFMFVDLASSTTIAEKIGNRKFLSLLNHFFSSLSDASIETGAEIYKYVGDEAILTWLSKDAAKEDRALECFFRFKNNLNLEEGIFRKEFDLVPEFRGAIHRGYVVSGELGVARKEIAYLGDVVNTTARLMETARDHGADLVVSQDFLELYIDGPSKFSMKPLGEESLRGKGETIQAFAVSEASP